MPPESCPVVLRPRKIPVEQTLLNALATALRDVEDHVAGAEAMAESMRERGFTRLARRFDDRRTKAAARASVIRDALGQGPARYS